MKINQENLKNLSKQSLFQYQKLFPVLTKEKNRQYGMLALTFIALTVFGIFAINPTLTTIAQLQKKAEDARLVDDQLSLKIDNLQKLRQQYQSLTPDLIFVERALPSKPSPIRFIGQIQTMSQLTSVQLTSLQIDTISLTNQIQPSQDATATTTEIIPETSVAVEQYSYTLGVNGTYAQVHEFLTLLTGFDRLTTIDTVNVSRATTDTPLVVLEITGTTFYKP